MTHEHVFAQLHEVVSGNKTKPDAEKIVIFDSTGSAIQDVAAAAIVYERAIERRIGQSLDLTL
jgi:alanine dehydrogenase